MSADGLPLLMGVQVVWFLRVVSSVTNRVGLRPVVAQRFLRCGAENITGVLSSSSQLRREPESTWLSCD